MQDIAEQQDYLVQDEKALRELYPPTHDLAIQKFQPSLGKHAQEFIRRSPFLCIGTQDMAGRADVSPRGDPPGFVGILSPTRLAIPTDRATTGSTVCPISSPIRAWDCCSSCPASTTHSGSMDARD